VGIQIKDISVENLLPLCKKVIIFNYLRSDEIRELIRIAQIYQYEKDEKIIAEGECSPYLYGVIEGVVNVMVKEADSQEVFICTIGEGDVFGEAGIFLKVKRTADVVSADKSVIMAIHRNDILKFIKKHPNIGIKMLMLVIYSLLRKLKEANHEIAFERKADIKQDDIDSMVDHLMREM
jgi:CRP/FNR family cyclic AMP-dependent transcriptional regulator